MRVYGKICGASGKISSKNPSKVKKGDLTVKNRIFAGDHGGEDRLASWATQREREQENTWQDLHVGAGTWQQGKNRRGKNSENHSKYNNVSQS